MGLMRLISIHVYVVCKHNATDFAHNKDTDQSAYLHSLISVFVIRSMDIIQIGPQRKKTCLRGVANNTGADQPAHPRSLIGAFVNRLFESTLCKLATGEISIL